MCYRGDPKTLHDTARHRLPLGSDPLPVFTVGPHVVWKLAPNLESSTLETQWRPTRAAHIIVSTVHDSLACS